MKMFNFKKFCAKTGNNPVIILLCNVIMLTWERILDAFILDS